MHAFHFKFLLEIDSSILVKLLIPSILKCVTHARCYTLFSFLKPKETYLEGVNSKIWYILQCAHLFVAIAYGKRTCIALADDFFYKFIVRITVDTCRWYCCCYCWCYCRITGIFYYKQNKSPHRHRHHYRWR